jgi:hypothetical protein
VRLWPHELVRKRAAGGGIDDSVVRRSMAGETETAADYPAALPYPLPGRAAE